MMTKAPWVRSPTAWRSAADAPGSAHALGVQARIKFPGPRPAIIVLPFRKHPWSRLIYGLTIHGNGGDVTSSEKGEADSGGGYEVAVAVMPVVDGQPDTSPVRSGGHLPGHDDAIGRPREQRRAVLLEQGEQDGRGGGGRVEAGRERRSPKQQYPPRSCD